MLLEGQKIVFTLCLEEQVTRRDVKAITTRQWKGMLR